MISSPEGGSIWRRLPGLKFLALGAGMALAGTGIALAVAWMRGIGFGIATAGVLLCVGFMGRRELEEGWPPAPFSDIRDLWRGH